MVISFQVNIVVGILLAYIQPLLEESAANDWRWMLGVVALPALAFSVMMMTTPETPRWLLLTKGDEAAARKVLSITDEEGVDAAIQDIRQSARR
jgi:MFS family permease